MRIAVAGAGAIGGVIAGSILRSGLHEVSLLARGPHLQAIRRTGLRYVADGTESRHHVSASDRPEDLGVHDVVLLTAKGHSLSSIVAGLGPLLSPDTVIVSIQNGIPWWFDRGLEAPPGVFPLGSVDPGGLIRSALSQYRSLGGVVTLPARIPEPGQVQHMGGPRQLTIGWPDRQCDDGTVRRLADDLSRSGIDARASPDIRAAMWTKLLLNLFYGPIGVLTGANVGQIEGMPDSGALRARIIDECVQIARAWGSDIASQAETLKAWKSSTPDHKSSMLQDHEAGRPLEIDPILNACLELGRARGIVPPSISLLHALVSLKTNKSG